MPTAMQNVVETQAVPVNALSDKERPAQLTGCAAFPCRCCDLAQTVVHIS
jgi:hypothetical protein